MSFRLSAMPDLSTGSHAFHHTLGSALAALVAGGTPLSRITVKMAGFGYPTCSVVRQSPPPGTPLSSGTLITIFVAGASYFNCLPVGMWRHGSEAGPGTSDLIDPLDDPLQKASNWLREGARLLDVRPDCPEDCARWIALFGLRADEWPSELWYPLAILLPNLQALAGTEHGIKFGLSLLLGLPVFAMSSKPQKLYLENGLYSRLGLTSTHLGMDFVVGPHTENLSAIQLTIGPVPLQTFESYRRVEKAELLQAVLDLLAPFDQKVHHTWRVEDPVRAPSLGIAERNSILGVNFYLGQDARQAVAVGE